jgi:DNA-binding NarL/FixJ family response regulator
MKRLRVLVADDHEIVREGLRVMIEREPGWTVCGVAENGRQAVDFAKKLKPDVTILDLNMPERDGLEAARQIRRALPETEILMLAAREAKDLIEQAFAAGAKSYVRKADAGRLLVPALKSLQSHKIFLTDRVSTALFSRFLNQPARGRMKPVLSEKLTAREREIVRLLAEGKSNKEAARALGISIRTSETHRAAVMRKLQVESVADLVRYAIRNGIVDA